MTFIQVNRHFSNASYMSAVGATGVQIKGNNCDWKVMGRVRFYAGVARGRGLTPDWKNREPGCKSPKVQPGRFDTAAYYLWRLNLLTPALEISQNEPWLWVVARVCHGSVFSWVMGHKMCSFVISPYKFLDGDYDDYYDPSSALYRRLQMASMDRQSITMRVEPDPPSEPRSSSGSESDAELP